MGNYLNPGNAGFEGIRAGEYVDKSGLIDIINRTIGTDRKLTCVSRPRRFGKSYAAQMLSAYYDRSCDSHQLFDDLEVASTELYEVHRNKYNVIYLDMSEAVSVAGAADVVPFVVRSLTGELRELLPGLRVEESFAATLVNAAELGGTRFVMIVDEWDAPIREAPHDPAAQRAYLEFLRSLFKNSRANARIFAAAYMTGILPIKKDRSQSAVSEFEEYSMVSPWRLAPYIGFTEAEVRGLCELHGADFSQMKSWYDGYSFPGVGSVYNPSSVMKAIHRGRFESYWAQTSAAENLFDYIRLDFAGLGETVARLLGGDETAVDTGGFSNDLVTFRNADDVLTLLVHLGYLAYDIDACTVRVPNGELRREFEKAVRQDDRSETVRRVAESARLIESTVNGDAEAVAAQIEKVHAESAALFYNSEQALRTTIKLAYFAYGDNYLKLEELPAGAGCADVVYLPKKDSPLPALVVELKWNSSACGAIAQIRDRRYPDALEGFGGDILLVGISYDKDAAPGHRRHTCVIERA